MVVLVGYSVAGIRIVVVVLNGRMSLSRQPRVIAGSRHDSGGPNGDTWGVRLGAQRERYCLWSVLLEITGIVNCFLFVPRICTIVCN